MHHRSYMYYWLDGEEEEDGVIRVKTVLCCRFGLEDIEKALEGSCIL